MAGFFSLSEDEAGHRAPFTQAAASPLLRLCAFLALVPPAAVELPFRL
jgi:hypothetical protein